MPSSLITCNNIPFPQTGPSGYNAAPGSTIVLALVSTVGVNSWSISCTSSDDITYNNGNFVAVNESKTQLSAYSYSFVVPPMVQDGYRGAALQFSSTVNGDPTTTITEGVWVLNYDGQSLFFGGESNERNKQCGNAAQLNDLTILVQTELTGAFFAGGDLAGNTVNQTVIGIDTVPLSISGLTTGNRLSYNGSHWINSSLNLAGGNAFVTGTLPTGNQAPQSITLTGDATSSGGTTVSAATVVSGLKGNSLPTIDGTTDGYLNWTGSAWQLSLLPVALPPSGAAGGDLSGTYPNPTVIKINGSSVPAGPLTTGFVLQASGSNSFTTAPINLAGGANYVTGQLPTSNQVKQSLTLTGDTTSSGGTTASATTVVGALQGNPLSLGTLSSLQDGYVLSWNGSNIIAVPTSSTVVFGQNFSFSNTGSDIGGYSQLLANATGLQNTLSGTSSSSSKTLIQAFATPSNSPNVDYIDAGTWQFNFYAYSSLAGAFVNTLIFDVYARTTLGAETLLFTVNSPNIQATSATLYTALYNQQSAIVLVNTERLVIKVSAQSTNVVSTTLSFVFDGISMASLVQTPITGGALQLGGDVIGITSANTVVNINGTSVPATPSANQVLVATSGTTATWEQISDAQVSSGAAIAYSKLNLTGNIVNADISSSAAIAVNKLAAGTSAQVLLSSATPTPTWTTISGSTALSNAGVSTVLEIDGYSSNAFTSAGTLVPIAATETILAASTNSPVYGIVGNVQTTNASATTIASWTPPINSTTDVFATLVGNDITTDGYGYRADLFFTAFRGSSGAPVINPSSVVPFNIRSNGTGLSGCTCLVTLATNAIEIQVQGLGSTTINWSTNCQIAVTQ